MMDLWWSLLASPTSAQGNSGEVWHRAAWEDVIIQSISSGRVDDKSDTGAACPDTVTRTGGGNRGTLTKQQATVLDYRQHRHQSRRNTAREALAGCHATVSTCPTSALLREKLLLKCLNKQRLNEVKTIKLQQSVSICCFCPFAFTLICSTTETTQWIHRKLV